MPRTHAISHRHAVADAARLVGGMQKNLSQAATREHRFFRDDRDHLAGAGIEHIGSETGERFVFVREVFRIVRERQQIDGNPADPADDARGASDALLYSVRLSRGGDGPVGGVSGVSGVGGHRPIVTACAPIRVCTSQPVDASTPP